MKKSGDLALKYLERKCPDEFSLKGDIKHTFEFTGISLDKPKVIPVIADTTQSSQSIQ